MKLSEAEPKIRTADLFMFKGTWGVSNRIRYWDNGYRWHQPYGWLPWVRGAWSHAEIATRVRLYPGGEPVLCSIGAVGSGVRPTPIAKLLKTYLEHGGAVAWAPLLDDDERPRVMKRMEEIWGSEYCRYFGYEQYAATAFRKALGWAGIKALDTDSKRFVCIEAVGVGYNMPNPAGLWPSDMVGMCEGEKPTDLQMMKMWLNDVLGVPNVKKFGRLEFLEDG